MFNKIIAYMKSKNITTVKVITVICLVILAAIFYKNVIWTSMTYNNANELLKAEQYESAEELFIKLDDYKDSKKLAKKSKNLRLDIELNKAIDYMHDEEYSLALPILKELGDYKISKSLFKQCIVLLEDQNKNNRVDPAYTEFYKAAKKEIKKYGLPKVIKDERHKKSYTVSGVCLITLFDFNRDGKSELIVAHRTDSGDFKYKIYTYHKGERHIVLENSFNTRNGYQAFEVFSASEGNLVYLGSYDSGRSVEIKDDDSETTLTWKKEGSKYYLNSESVSKKKYKKSVVKYNKTAVYNGSPIENFKNNADGFYIYCTDHLSEAAALNLASQTEECYNTLKTSYDRTK
ncbi:MAG: hypothetical protein IJS03_03575 [Eubacterium sp.]|nr:hypothetical protein [Eubacterium sp.]